MKKIFAVLLCAFLICATPIVAFAEGEDNATGVTENTSAEVIVTEGENLASEPTVPDQIVSFIKENYEGSTFLSLAITIAVYTYFAVKKYKSLHGTIGVLNNNAIKVASDSTDTIGTVMSKAEELAANSSKATQAVLVEAGSLVEVVRGYKEEFSAALSELRKNAEEKESLEDTLLSVQKTLELSKLASMELANEVAELLVLANIPNAKKEELYARHRAAVDAIATAEKTEVINHDGKET